MPERLTGQLDRIIYQNPENNWTVAKMAVKGSPDLVTVVGVLPSPQPGELLEVTGEWKEHPKFGRQLTVESCRTIPPSTTDGIERYLSSGLIKGIGEVMAHRMVEEFGEDTMEVIENDIQKLKKIEGIGQKRVRMISESWSQHREMKELMVFLQSHGVSTGLAMKVYRQYGHMALEVVKKNPYSLVSDIFGVGFLTADKVAQNIGFDRESVLRAESGVLFVLGRMAEKGHVCFPENLLLNESQKLLEISRDIVERGLKGLMDRGRVIREEVVEDEAYIYPRPLYIAERGIARHLAGLVHYGANLPAVNWGQTLSWVEKKLGIELNEEQRNAIKGALVNKVFVITGGPGTGKTTIIRGIIELMNSRRLKVLLAAPTGRAAKRLSETSHREAKTIHRMLEYNPMEGGFKRNIDHPLDADAVVIDEASMVDTSLMYSLVKALPLKSSLILVGDVNQLPSVGPGSVLRDVIDSKISETVRLVHIFRQAQQSRIIINAHRINEGLFPVINHQNTNAVLDFYFLEQEDPDRVLAVILELCTKRIPERFGFDPLHDVQVLSPMNKGTVGVININGKLQEALNPRSVELTRGDRNFKIGDKVMQLRNNYEKEVFNGDIGNILSVDREGQKVRVEFDTGPVVYSFSETDELTLAYAISIHKSQGSEYPAIIVPLLPQHYMLLQRNLLYTAVTRGKKLVIILGSKKALSIAINNDKPLDRHTLLKKRLRDELTGALEKEPDSSDFDYFEDS
jgi:exodeoxyribonuclease V alpha subunit